MVLRCGLKRDHYQTLGVRLDADAAEIKRAYRKLARKLHPDVNRSKDAAERMVEVNEAYRTLSSAKLRGEYDALSRRGVSDVKKPKARAAGEVLVTHHISVVDLPSPVYAAAFSPNGGELALGCFDNTLRCLDTRTGDPLWELRLSGGAVSELRWLANDSLVAAGVGDKTVSSWLIEDCEVVESRSRRMEWVSQVAISPDGKRLALGGADSSFALIERRTGKKKFANRWHESSIVAIAYSADGKMIATAGNDRKIILLESKEGVPMCRFDVSGAEPTRVVFSGDGSLLAAALVDRSIRIYEMHSGRPRKAFWGHEAGIEAIAFHPNSWLLASADRGGQTRLWNALGGQQITVLGGHRAPVKSLAFAGDGRLLAAGGLDRTVSLWRVEVGEKA